MSESDVGLADSWLKLVLMTVRGVVRAPLRWASGNYMLIGSGVRIRQLAKIKFKGRLVLEDYCEIQGLSTGGINFGRNCTVGAFSVVRPSGYYSREKGVGLVVGDNSSIGIQCYIGCGGGVEIGDNVMMGPKVSIHSENHVFEGTDISMKDQGVRRASVIIGDNVWIGAGVRILSGVRLGAGSVMAAGAVITKDVPEGAVVGGIPAKTIKQGS